MNYMAFLAWLVCSSSNLLLYCLIGFEKVNKIAFSFYRQVQRVAHRLVLVQGDCIRYEQIMMTATWKEKWLGQAIQTGYHRLQAISLIVSLQLSSDKWCQKHVWITKLLTKSLNDEPSKQIASITPLRDCITLPLPHQRHPLEATIRRSQSTGTCATCNNCRLLLLWWCQYYHGAAALAEFNKINLPRRLSLRVSIIVNRGVFTRASPSELYWHKLTYTHALNTCVQVYTALIWRKKQ